LAERKEVAPLNDTLAAEALTARPQKHPVPALLLDGLDEAGIGTALAMERFHRERFRVQRKPPKAGLFWGALHGQQRGPYRPAYVRVLRDTDGPTHALLKGRNDGPVFGHPAQEHGDFAYLQRPDDAIKVVLRYRIGQPGQ